MAISTLWLKPPRWPIQPGAVDPGQRWVWHTRPRFILPVYEHASAGAAQRYVRLAHEDVGGPWGYAEFLAAIADPTHEEHQHMLTWCGGAFDPNSPDIEHIADQLDRLARRWEPRKPKTTSPRS
jgi:hypothetical protein